MAIQFNPLEGMGERCTHQEKPIDRSRSDERKLHVGTQIIKATRVSTPHAVFQIGLGDDRTLGNDQKARGTILYLAWIAPEATTSNLEDSRECVIGGYRC
jgi:hypothetical protein